MKQPPDGRAFKWRGKVRGVDINALTPLKPRRSVMTTMTARLTAYARSRAPQSFSPREAMEAIGATGPGKVDAVRVALRRLAQRGVLVHIGHADWVAASHGTLAARAAAESVMRSEACCDLAIRMVAAVRR